MPVKVRCTTCDKVLNAPDAARGKAIKCPGCQGKISVPAEGGGGSSAAPKKAKPKKPVDEDEEFLSSLDLDKSVDAESPVCPKCGADVDVEDIECPSCGVNVQTGQLSAKRQKKAALKGQDPDDYYKKAIPDSWRFMVRHTGYAAQAAMLGTVLALLVAGLLVVAAIIPKEKMPPKVFCMAFATAAYLGIPGWYWHVFLATVKHTMGRKDQLKDVKFDIVTSMADGIKFTLWSAVYFLPASIATRFLVPIVGIPNPNDITSLLTFYGILIGPQLVIYAFAAPAFVHLSSYSEWRGWVLPIMLGKFVRVPGQCLLWMVTAVIGMLFSAVLVVAAMFTWTLFLFGIVGPIVQKMGQAAAEAGAQQQEIQYGMAAVAAAVVLLLVYLTLFAMAFGVLFAGRSAGLFGFYCKDHLDIVARPAEQKWVSKSRKLDEDGNPITPVWVTIAGIIGVSLLFAVAAYIIMRQMG